MKYRKTDANLRKPDVQLFPITRMYSEKLMRKCEAKKGEIIGRDK